MCKPTCTGANIHTTATPENQVFVYMTFPTGKRPHECVPEVYI
jgi:hypothetical protein